MGRLYNRADTSMISEWWWTVDKKMLYAFVFLIICGVMAVATASPAVASKIGLNQYHFVIRHLIFLFPTVVVMVGISFLSKTSIRRLGIVMFLCVVLALILTLIIGYEVKGAQRWIRVLGFSLQPSEFLKPAFIIVSAWLLSQKQKQENFPGFLVSAGIYLIAVSLLLLQPDLGMTILLSSIWAGQLFLAGLPIIYVVGLSGVGVIGLIAAYFLFPHFQTRMNKFLDPNSGDNYQVEKAETAFQNGGLFGVGPGEGTAKMSIPDVHADFIFAAMAEEMGIIFVLLILFSFSFIVWRSYANLRKNEDYFCVLAIGGLFIMLGLQAFIHIGANVQILPAKGMTLPFISYGGSSLIALGITAGMLLGLTRSNVRS